MTASATGSGPTDVGGPYFDDFEVGHRFDAAPSVTFTDGLAAVHQSILGDRMRLPVDAHLSRRVGGGAAFVHPGLVCDMAIGQSTLATHHVRANLFYRGLRMLGAPRIGDTLTTVTTVVGLRENSAKAGRAPTGLAALHIESHDQSGRRILDFHRCAMLPFSPDHGGTGPQGHRHDDDLSVIGRDRETDTRPDLTDYDLAAFRAAAPGDHFRSDLLGRVFRSSGDVVSGAPELARATLNIAATHHDARATGHRLVYGGHTIGVALAQATRALPDIVTVTRWESCEHLGPVREGDTLSSELTVTACSPEPQGGGTADLRSIVHAHDAGSDSPRAVLDWSFTVLLA
ncbi:acyl dehydratase [uncultured Williamsia sp.]|uniref:acyl dehydratase n=1 Tax=uncultured Williamsia sp. TaxID=259311 RepID=UPI0026183117|nr:acyl dehydratase [uncultured Williamsia sp.]